MKLIRFTPKQVEAYEAAKDNTITLYGGAIRGGKTYWLILVIWVLAKAHKNSRWVIIRNSHDNLVRNTLPVFNQLLSEGLNNDMKEWSQAMKTATLFNGSQIIFMAESYDNDKELNKFRGFEINGAGLDELNELQETTFNKIIERAGSWQHSPSCPIKILASCNPTHGWVKPRIYDKWKLKTLPKGYAYVPAKITDNPHISKQYIESLKMLPVYEYKVFVEGDWEVMPKTGGEFYAMFNGDRNVKDLKYNQDIPLHITFDFNVHPYCTLCIWQVLGKEATQIDEMCLSSPKNNTASLCREFLFKYRNHQSGLFIYGDPAGKHEDTRQEEGYNDYSIIYKELSQFKPTPRVASKAPPVVMRGKFINDIFEREAFGIKIIIGRSCLFTIADYFSLKQASDGTKEKKRETDPNTKISYEKYGHCSDANDYLLCEVFKNEFAEFTSGGKTPAAIFSGYKQNEKKRY